jgi:hypothetical protein
MSNGFPNVAEGETFRDEARASPLQYRLPPLRLAFEVVAPIAEACFPATWYAVGAAWVTLPRFLSEASQRRLGVA